MCVSSTCWSFCPVTVPAGADPPKAAGTVEHSVSHRQLFEATGQKDQQVLLTHTPYLDSSAQVSAGGSDYVWGADPLLRRLGVMISWASGNWGMKEGAVLG